MLLPIHHKGKFFILHFPGVWYQPQQQFLFHQRACEHCGFPAAVRASNTELVTSSPSVRRGTASLASRLPCHQHPSTTSFRSSAIVSLWGTQNLNAWSEARSEYLVCNPVIQDSSHFFFTDLNTWPSETGIDSGNIMILNLKGLSCWFPRNAQATCRTDANLCSEREPSNRMETCNWEKMTGGWGAASSRVTASFTEFAHWWDEALCKCRPCSGVRH